MYNLYSVSNYSLVFFFLLVSLCLSCMILLNGLIVVVRVTFRLICVYFLVHHFLSVVSLLPFFIFVSYPNPKRN